LQDFEREARRGSAEVEATIRKMVKDLQGDTDARYGSITQRLEGRLQSMEDVYSQCNATLQKLWLECTTIFEEAEPLKQVPPPPPYIPGVHTLSHKEARVGW